MTTKIPLKTELSPLELYRRIRSQEMNTVLLESMDPPSRHARQSIICFSPTSILRIDNGRLYLDGVLMARDLSSSLVELRSIIQTYSTDEGGLFNGGFVGFTSYSIVHELSGIPESKGKEFPDAMYGLYLDGVVYDHVRGETYYFHSEKVPSRLELLSDLIQLPEPPAAKFSVTEPHFNFSRREFVESVNFIKHRIVDGETYQTVLSQRGDFKVSGDRFGLYERLREVNPSPYMYCIEFHDLAVIGSSPELLVSLHEGVVTTFPIAGTRPRGRTRAERERYRDELLSDRKELAEHNMLVDLARNDVGKVARVGSVFLAQYLSIEEFSHVIHIVSEVRGELDPSMDQFDAFFALFPAGTVSGAPKLRSMQFINSLEKDNRGPYAGAVGYFGLDGSMVQAIAIRSFFGRRDNFHLQAGAGIVHDSVPEAEYEETLNKLGALFRAMAVE